MHYTLMPASRRPWGAAVIRTISALAEVGDRAIQDGGDRRRAPWRSLEAVEFATLAWVDWFKMRAAARADGLRAARRIRSALLSADRSGLSQLTGCCRFPVRFRMAMLKSIFYTGPSLRTLHATYAKQGRIDTAAAIMSHADILVRAPVDRVWQILGDAPHWPAWVPGLAETAS